MPRVEVYGWRRRPGRGREATLTAPPARCASHCLQHTCRVTRHLFPVRNSLIHQQNVVLELAAAPRRFLQLQLVARLLPMGNK